MVASERHDPRRAVWHRDALAALRKHEDCKTVIADLIAERDDVIAGIVAARGFAFNDVYKGEYGDLYVSAGTFLDLLPPTLRGTGRLATLDTSSEWCPECDERVHEDSCALERHVEERARQRTYGVASHLHCVEMGEAIIAHTAMCLDRAELIASTVAEGTQRVHGDDVFDPHDVLPDMDVTTFNVAFDHTPRTLFTALDPPLEDAAYCDSGEGFHTEPHRACRYLVS